MSALVTGSGGLPKVALAAADGARFEAYLHGAHVTSWVPAGERESRLWLSPLAHYRPDSSIRGGIPVCFPQFADQGPLPMHGFARTSAWTLALAERAGDGAAVARFRLADSDATRALWPHAFACELTVHARGARLAVELAVANTGGSAFTFTTALHSYLAVRNARDVVVHGLSGARYRDKVLRRDDDVEAAPELQVDRPLDRVYRATPELTLREPGRTLIVRAHGVADTVVWNPGPPRDPSPIPGADMAPDAWQHFLCVEAAVASTTVTLAPGAEWRGSQTLEAA
jgi:glucose-6-phosphate 1-epimerase